VGSPLTVLNPIERWLHEEAADGFIYHGSSPRELELFLGLAVPILRDAASSAAMLARSGTSGYRCPRTATPRTDEGAMSQKAWVIPLAGVNESSQPLVAQREVIATAECGVDGRDTFLPRRSSSECTDDPAGTVR
jgi:hypothetical protein